ncbi:L-glutamate gamma-semialdehyde dehydrogenase [Paenibacillus athensensis]|uniref:L-glutamate gamma-semialdehyde dehydrogenase n=1 Tax=Paenibacillus athensensis TaxID=1967502 RepID=A0A4Y8QAK4_9BACL|nr:L-glutamate gamma-semialdehyde dehydrogenase [Paenibacillus athensensis]MCD1257543.1 L-glutamate gamma-semialdehyde dehydrogenase [Paenibacillus athensensis]
MIPYRPEPLTDFRSADAAAAFDTALAAVERQLGVETPLVIGGRRIMTERRLRSINPSARDETVGLSAQADAALAEQALLAANRAYADWSRRTPQFRADLLLKAAALLRRRKHEFSAWLLLEAGKSRGEADADTAEAIDFLEYYARQALQLELRAAAELVALPGENNRLSYLPLGVGVIIAPWNFPLAILVGMSMAAVVAGNTVVVKPASATPIIAAKWQELLEEAGLPDGVVQLLPGSGSEIGDYLVTHPLTRFVSFTGSRDVGVHIAGLAAQLTPGQKWLKRYVAEMGGKDGIVVNADADLELAAAGIVASAFGYSGQKCSACSRAIVHEAVYDELLERCTALTAKLTVGDVRDPHVYTGPVIDESSQRKIAGYLALAPQEGRVVAGGQLLEGTGFFVQPTLVADVAPDARLMQEEIFGPVLAFAKARDWTEALRIANDTDYGLTGSVYTRSRAAVEAAIREFHVGNLYINRKCTGAVVGAHPFGGFNMSGTDSKAGGPDYLQLFTQLKLVSELL